MALVDEGRWSGPGRDEGDLPDVPLGRPAPPRWPGAVRAGGADRELLGGDHDGNHKTMEFYEPSYCFAPDDLPAVRPTITAVRTDDDGQGVITYGAWCRVETPQAPDIAGVALMRPGAMTHHTEDRPLRRSFTSGKRLPTMAQVQAALREHRRHP